MLIVGETNEFTLTIRDRDVLTLKPTSFIWIKECRKPVQSLKSQFKIFLK